MYKKIYVPVDNSAHSNRAVESSVRLGKAFGSEIVGCHVYAAKMHDYRFKQMEYSLPEEYLEENELERQRKIHDSLITMGLKLISDSYLEGIKVLCEREQLPFEARMIDGKNHTEICRDLRGSDSDLVIIGAGVSGMAAAMEAKQRGLKHRVVEVVEEFATLVNFPKGKPIFTYPERMKPLGELQVSADTKETLIEELRNVAPSRTGPGRGAIPR